MFLLMKGRLDFEMLRSSITDWPQSCSGHQVSFERKHGTPSFCILGDSFNAGRVFPLSERFLTTIYPTNKWFGLCVNEHMFLKVLLKREALPTEVAAELLDSKVGWVVPSKSELGAVLFSAVLMFTYKSSLLHLIITNVWSVQINRITCPFLELNLIG